LGTIEPLNIKLRDETKSRARMNPPYPIPRLRNFPSLKELLKKCTFEAQQDSHWTIFTKCEIQGYDLPVAPVLSLLIAYAPVTTPDWASATAGVGFASLLTLKPNPWGRESNFLYVLFI
jgi:hypothetical protein